MAFCSEHTDHHCDIELLKKGVEDMEKKIKETDTKVTALIEAQWPLKVIVPAMTFMGIVVSTAGAIISVLLQKWL